MPEIVSGYCVVCGYHDNLSDNRLCPNCQLSYLTTASINSTNNPYRQLYYSYTPTYIMEHEILQQLQQKEQKTMTCYVCNKEGYFSHEFQNGVVCNECVFALGISRFDNRYALYTTGKEWPVRQQNVVLYGEFGEIDHRYPTYYHTAVGSNGTIVLRKDIRIVNRGRLTVIWKNLDTSTDCYIDNYGAVTLDHFRGYYCCVQNYTSSSEVTIIDSEIVQQPGHISLNGEFSARIENCQKIALELAKGRDVSIKNSELFITAHKSIAALTLDQTILTSSQKPLVCSSINANLSELRDNPLVTELGELVDSIFTMYENPNVVIRGGTITIKKVEICYLCGEKANVFSGRMVEIKGKTVHNSCFAQNGHGDANEKRKGTGSNLPAFSFELEMEANYNNEDYQEFMLALMQDDFIRCSDGTVTDEMKSPIFINEKTFQESLHLLKRAVPYVQSNCGTHIHVSLPRAAKQYYAQHMSVFYPLTAYMQSRPTETVAIWGRYFNRWARDNWRHDRYYWINFSSSYDTVEYRLAFLTGDEQFANLVHLVRLFSQKLKSLHASLPSFSRGTILEGSLLDYYKKTVKDMGLTKEEKQPITPSNTWDIDDDDDEYDDDNND